MYSKNDYRYYLEHRCEESDDFLMHYGVKGMKWKDHKYAGVTGWLSAKGHNTYLGRGAKSKTFAIGRTTVSIGTNKRNGRSALTIGRKGGSTPIRSFTYDKNKSMKKLKKKLKSGEKSVKSAAKKASRKANISRSVDAAKRKADRLGSAAKREFASARKTANRELSEAKRSAASVANKAKKTANRELGEAKRTAKSAANKAKTTANKTKHKVNQGIQSAKRTASSTANKAKKQAKKAYKYADDHIDRYSYSGRGSNGSYHSTGVRVKTKNTTTDLGVYSSSSSRIDRNGKSRSIGGDLGIEYTRDNRKKRKVRFGSAGIGTRYGVPVYVARHNSKKY